MTDKELERQIRKACKAINDAQDLAERRKAFERMKALIEQRSPQRVAQMERDRGLAR